ncbi:MAG TPA: HlyC/CorC family transporter [bacterium]|nr:HlyC/CorC family transporter [bacterium]
MEADAWISLVVFIGLIAFSAFFSGSESAFFAIPQHEINRFRRDKLAKKSIRRMVKLLNSPGRLLLSVLIGNTIVNVAAATVAALFIHGLIQQGLINRHLGILLEIITVTLVLLIFSEVSPKIFAVKQPVRFASMVSLPLSIFIRIVSPLTHIFEQLTHGFTVLLGVKKESPFVDEQELKALFNVGEDNGALDENEREMIHSIFTFGETTVKEVMIPRTDMICVEKDTGLEEVLRLVKEKGHSRIPVYDGTVDNISGILFVKDLLPYSQDMHPGKNLTELVRKPYFVPESKMIDELLREFQLERLHMAIVVDEYGGTAGLVTLEDVIEEIVGEIRDEFDREKPLVRQIDTNTWIVEGKINIEDLNEALTQSFPAEEDYETLGGFLLSLLGHIPSEKEEIKYGSWHMIIEKVVGQRITKVRMIKETALGGET